MILYSSKINLLICYFLIGYLSSILTRLLISPQLQIHSTDAEKTPIHFKTVYDLFIGDNSLAACILDVFV